MPIKVRRMREEQQRLARLGAAREATASVSQPVDAHQPQAADTAGSEPAHADGEVDAPGAGQRGTESLLQLAAKSRREKPEETDAEKALKEEQELLKATTKQKALQGVQELARVCDAQEPASCCNLSKFTVIGTLSAGRAGAAFHRDLHPQSGFKWPCVECAPLSAACN